MIGEQLGRYLVEEEVGQGGMSVVYRGQDTVLKRPVAIKVLHPHLQSRAESRARFEREALAVAKLSHPNILQIYDFSEVDAARSYIVTEFLRGRTLRDFIDDHALDHPEIAAMMGVQLCDAVQHAHELGIIHRDIKPENVMICDDGSLKLMDFGIAQIVDAHAMTITGTLLGSPAHMSPEMIEGLPLDFRADVFSMGTLIYFAATGELPFSGPNPPLVLKAILEGDYDEAEMVNPRVGRTLSRIIDRCLARDADDRYDSVMVLRERLMTFLAGCDLEELDEWLPPYLKDPATTELALRGHLLEALERHGRNALKAGRVAQALEYFNRVLAIDPEHEQVLKLIKRIDRRRKLYVYVGAGAMLLVTGAVLLWASGATDDTQDQPTAVPPVEVGEKAEVNPVDEASALADSVWRGSRDLSRSLGALAERNTSEESAKARAQEVVKGSERIAVALTAEANKGTVRTPPKNNGEEKNPPRELTQNKDPDPDKKDEGSEQDKGDPKGDGTKPVSERPRELVTLRFHLQFPKNGIKVKVNGKEYSKAQLTAGVTLPRGPKPFKFVASHPLCQTHRGSIIHKGKDLFNVPIKLKFKPGRLFVDAGDDTGATVQVFDITGTHITTGYARRAISVPIIDKENPRRRLRVNVIPSLTGRKTAKGSVTVEAGRTMSMSVNLKR